uniref:Uncharacterized protein n=1 Tax=Anguilla anguilla TaxID=7936 RepID=A0A0E9S337_ANGAN
MLTLKNKYQHVMSVVQLASVNGTVASHLRTHDSMILLLNASILIYLCTHL